MSEDGQNEAIETAKPRARVLSGMRPTGRLHLGNYMGALYNWVKLQHEYECYFFIADYHALTTDYADTSRLKQNLYEIALDFLAGGLDPAQCTIFVQSHVPQHAELNLIFSMFTPLSWLERVPTYKDQQDQLREKDLNTYGFLGYPLLQAADILLYQPAFVPVGQDQEAHVELTREVGRRFNHFYPNSGPPVPDRLLPILPEPQVLLTPSPKLPGTDGRKMSKSYGNSILMAEPFADVIKKTAGMSNGGQRPTQHDPGDPEICPVGDLHRVFSEPDVDAHVRQGCRTATIRCDQCKYLVGGAIGQRTHSLFSRRMEIAARPDYVWQVLEEGALRAQARAEETMREVRSATGLSRDRSGVRIYQAVYPKVDASVVRDLTGLRDWWGLSPAVLARNIREHWRLSIVPSSKALKLENEGVWLTRSKQRVFVAVATEEPESVWTFSIKPKSYEIVVLLCWGRDLILHDFVLPQKVYVTPWTAAKKAAGKGDMVFSVERRQAATVLELPGAESIDITAYEAGYDIIGE